MKIKNRKERITLNQYLCGIRDRLRNDVGEYLELTKPYRVKGRAVGYFALPRLMMPIIETLAKVYYPRDKEGRNYKLAIIKFIRLKLDYKFPYLIWAMFRHPLIHGDQPSVLIYGKNTVYWTLMFGAKDHVFERGHINFDLNKLYNDLEDFLIKEIRKNHKKMIWREHETQFIKPGKEIKKEFNKICL